MNTLVFLGVFFAVILAAVLVFQYTKDSRQKEGFASLGDYGKLDRTQYIKLGQNRYNPVADNIDVFRPGVIKNMTEAQIQEFNRLTNDAIMSTQLQPSVNLDMNTNTTVEVYNPGASTSMPKENNVLKAATKCEAVKTRDACSILGNPEYSNCGVCILGGTDTKEENKGKFIGGMLLLERDRKSAETNARGTGLEPVYEPTTGECPAGYMFADRIKCQKAVNRQNCKEAGQSGGFNGGKTIEGKEVVKESCAFCFQSGEDNTYIYEPKTRNFPIALRVITPVGTGTNTVRIEGFDQTTKVESVLATGTAEGGKEIYLNLSGVVFEGQDIKIAVDQELPHRPRGKSEVFQVGPGYIYNYEEANNVCKKLGADMATYKQLEDSFNAGAQLCSYGYYKDSKATTKVGYPMQVGELRKDLQAPHDTSGWCGRGVGIRDDYYGWGNEDGSKATKFGAWCYGIKPPTGWNGNLYVHPFFGSVGNASVPSQENQPSINSQYGSDYVAPYYRGVIMQWEMRGDTEPAIRRASVEPSIVSVEGYAPNTVTTDGFKMFKILRRLGMFSTSTRNPSAKIIAPNSNTNKNIMANQYWIWNNNPDKVRLFISAKVPGIFRDPFYPEDKIVCPRGPLVGDKSTLDLLKVSPCLRDSEGAGKYSIECLKFLFLGAGGDIYNGRLSPLNGDVNKLLFDEKKKALEQDEILDKLSALYTVATKGRDIMGSMVSPNNKKMRRQIINDAAMDMFGKEIVSPCEEVTESAGGDILLVPKSAPFDAECLDYLFLNTGTDKSRGMEGPRDTTVGATYTSIGDRFSGLLFSEKASPEERDKTPFQTCQRVGTMSPIDAAGKINTEAIVKANAWAATGSGSIRDVQNYYNQVFKDANMSVDGSGTPDKNLLKKQEDAIQQCFGIKKVIDPKNPLGCGLMVRYVRLLRSLSGAGANRDRVHREIRQNRDWGSLIKVSQVQVFDPMEQEIGKGKPVTSGSNREYAKFANDGKAFVKNSYGSDVYIEADGPEDGNEFWMLDLQDLMEVRKIRVFNTRVDPQFLNEAVLQLLDADKKVITHKILPSFTDSTDIVFSKQDLASSIMPGEVRPGVRCYLQNGAFFTNINGTQIVFARKDRLNPYSYYNVEYIPLNAAANKTHAALEIQPSLAGITGAITIALANQNNFILHPWGPEKNAPLPGSREIGFVDRNVWVGANDTKAQRLASWIVRPALTGQSGWFTLQNALYTNLYLIPWPQAGGVWGWTIAAATKSNNLAHQVLSCWRAININGFF